jgi:hypothetical protein
MLFYLCINLLQFLSLITSIITINTESKFFPVKSVNLYQTTRRQNQQHYVLQSPHHKNLTTHCFSKSKNLKTLCSSKSTPKEPQNTVFFKVHILRASQHCVLQSPHPKSLKTRCSELRFFIDPFCSKALMILVTFLEVV